ncbi:MAG TPA: glutamine synthetase family protein [Clostridia bacterium]
MTLKSDEILGFIKENDVKFIKLAFCDIKGEQKNISIMADKLEDALRFGIYFDSSNISGFESESGELMLKPDLSTISILPWRPQQGRVVRFYCNIFNPDGTPFKHDTRALLMSAQSRCQDMGYQCSISTEAEFYIFKTDSLGNPTTSPYDEGGYSDMAPLDKGENIRREICLNLLEMGIDPEKSHHESGPGQHEIDFKHSAPLKAADNFLAFKSLVKAVCGRNGVYASFLPKPLKNKSGSGLHINLSLNKLDEKNILAENEKLDTVTKSFIAGVLKHIVEITAFLNPLSNSYQRLGKFEAPSVVDWAYGSRSALIRIPAAFGDKKRIEIRSADCAINPYLALTLIINAGLDGIKNNLELNENSYKKSRLPISLKEAVLAAQSSTYIDSIIGKETKQRYLSAIIDQAKKKSFFEMFKII